MPQPFQRNRPWPQAFGGLVVWDAGWGVCNPADGLFGDQRVLRPVDIDELAPDMGHAGEFADYVVRALPGRSALRTFVLGSRPQLLYQNPTTLKPTSSPKSSPLPPPTPTLGLMKKLSFPAIPKSTDCPKVTESPPKISSDSQL